MLRLYGFLYCSRVAAALAGAALLAGCTVISIAGAAVGTAAWIGTTAVSTTVGVASTAVKVTGSAVGGALDLVTPGSGEAEGAGKK